MRVGAARHRPPAVRIARRRHCVAVFVALDRGPSVVRGRCPREGHAPVSGSSGQALRVIRNRVGRVVVVVDVDHRRVRPDQLHTGRRCRNEDQGSLSRLGDFVCERVETPGVGTVRVIQEEGVRADPVVDALFGTPEWRVPKKDVRVLHVGAPGILEEQDREEALRDPDVRMLELYRALLCRPGSITCTHRIRPVGTPTTPRSHRHGHQLARNRSRRLSRNHLRNRSHGTRRPRRQNRHSSPDQHQRDGATPACYRNGDAFSHSKTTFLGPMGRVRKIPPILDALCEMTAPSANAGRTGSSSFPRRKP